MNSCVCYQLNQIVYGRLPLVYAKGRISIATKARAIRVNELVKIDRDRAFFPVRTILSQGPSPFMLP